MVLIGMTTEQHKCLGRASRNLIYAIRWLEKALADEMPEREQKRVQQAKELVEKATNKL